MKNLKDILTEKLHLKNDVTLEYVDMNDVIKRYNLTILANAESFISLDDTDNVHKKLVANVQKFEDSLEFFNNIFEDKNIEIDIVSNRDNQYITIYKRGSKHIRINELCDCQISTNRQDKKPYGYPNIFVTSNTPEDLDLYKDTMFSIIDYILKN